MNFFEILNLVEYKELINKPKKDFLIEDIFKDSREVTSGSLFCAMGKDILDGHQFINDAIKKGATAIIAEKKVDISFPGIPVLIVKDSITAFAKLSSYFFGEPGRDLDIIGITGTNGKTTSTYIIEEIFKSCNIKPGVIGTVNYRYNNKILTADNTTPHANHYQRLLSLMKDDGVSHVISEISSHGISLRRVYNLKLNTAVFTNLTLDHLDFHKDFEDYYQTKKRLFTEILDSSNKKGKKAIVNIDDKYGKRLFDELSQDLKKNYDLYSISMHEKNADFYTNNLKISLDTSSFTVSFKEEKIDFYSPLIGHHNVMNILGAVSIGFLYKLPKDKIANAIKNLKIVPGRLEKIKSKGRRHVFVDYAHTPDALENVLTALKKICRKRILTVFGCGGDRDKSKRPLMGSIAQKFSDIVFVTSDNPRTEDPDIIINDILTGIEGKKETVVEVDRKSAIRKALSISEAGDVVLIAGKGHEDYQIIGNKKNHFSDKEVVEEILNEIE